MPLELTCPRCQSLQSFGQQFCRSCGTSLGHQVQPVDNDEVTLLQSKVPAAIAQNKSVVTLPSLALMNRKVITLIIGGLLCAGIFIIIAARLKNISFNGRASSSDAAPENVTSDEAKVLTELIKIQLDWIEANIKGDGEKLNYILADEYRGSTGDGESLNKTQAIAKRTANPNTTHYENMRVEDAKLVDYHGDTATLSGVIRAEYAENNQIIHYQQRFTGSFVKRDGRWQAISSQAGESFRQ